MKLTIHASELGLILSAKNYTAARKAAPAVPPCVIKQLLRNRKLDLTLNIS